MRPFWSFLESRAKFLRSKVHFLDLQVCCDWSTFFSTRFSRRLLGRIAWRACDQLTAVKTVSHSQYHMTVLRAQVWAMEKTCVFEVIRWLVTCFWIHRRTNSKWISLQWLQVYCLNQIINLFTGASPCLNLYIITSTECVRVLYHQALFQNSCKVKMKKNIF